MTELSIVIPLYNEEKSLKKVVSDLKKELIKNKIDFELVLVNNGSWDKTKDLINELSKEDKRVRTVHIVKNQGYGFGIINGLNTATSKYVGYIDGDGQIRPTDVIKCYNKIKETGSDICKGKRRSKSGTFLRKFSSYFYDFLFFVFFFRYYQDINAKPKIMKKSILPLLNLKSKRWFIDSEILIEAVKNKLKICESSVVVESREKGKSYVRIWIVLEFLESLIKNRFGLK